MQKQIKSSMKFINYIVERAEFTYNIACNDEDEFQLDYNIDTEFDIDSTSKEMILILDVEVFQNALENNYPFNFKLRVIGFFKMDFPENELEKYKTSAVAILYPYIRSLVTTYTANSNVTPLILPTINVNKYISEKSTS